MALGGSDLNLLLALKVLLEEGNVTRAGQRLGLSQPAMSTSLARMRRRFSDELLTRSGRDYELTSFAVDLLPEVQEAVLLISRALRVDEPFDPSTSDRVFRMTMSDYAITVLHEPLLDRVRTLAPGVRLEVEPLGPGVRSSERVLVDYDVLIAPLGYGFPGESRPLWRDRMVCLVDPKNPGLRDGTLSMSAISTLPHAVATFGRGNLTPIDRVFGELNVNRRIQVQVPGWLTLPFVIEGTDLVAVVPERLARIHTRPGTPLVMVEPPFGNVVLAEGYWFAPSRMLDPAHRWLFDRLDEVGAGLSVEEPQSSAGQ